MNPINEIGHGLKVAAVDVAHGIEFVGHVGSDVAKVIEDAKALTPAFKAELQTVLTDIQPIAATLFPVIAAKGMDVALDLESVEPVLAEIKKLVADLVSFMPTLEKALDELKADVSGDKF